MDNYETMFKAEYAANKVQLSRAGISEAAYFSSRRVSEGLEPLISTRAGMITLDVPEIGIEATPVADDDADAFAPRYAVSGELR